MQSATQVRRTGTARKALIGAVTLVTLALVFSACGSNDDGGGSTASSTTASGKDVRGQAVPFDKAPAALALDNPSPAQCPADGKKLTIGYDRYSDSDENVLAMSKPLQESLKKMGCVELLTLTDNLDPATVLRNMQTFVQRKVDGVILQNALADVQPAATKVLKKAGIPVVAISITAPDAPFVGPDDYANGVIGGQEAANEFKKRFPGADPHAVLLSLPKSGETPKRRHDGFLAGIKKVFPNLSSSSITDVSADATATSARDRTIEALGRVPDDAKLIVAGVNDATAHGMLRAVRQRGRSDDAVVVGQGGVPPTSTSYICNEPEWAGTVANFPEQSGIISATSIVNLANGKSIPDWISIPGKWMNRENMATFYPSAVCSK